LRYKWKSSNQTPFLDGSPVLDGRRSDPASQAGSAERRARGGSAEQGPLLWITKPVIEMMGRCLACGLAAFGQPAVCRRVAGCLLARLGARAVAVRARCAVLARQGCPHRPQLSDAGDDQDRGMPGCTRL